jgi:hypothetical protein
MGNGMFIKMPILPKMGEYAERMRGVFVLALLELINDMDKEPLDVTQCRRKLVEVLAL